uniref:Uncharacterized protein n=1 Tax=Hyaloperonospora arabidopsidis (strain Emoy2) TaxID=559515 RepID=M4BEL7_HYAAE
MQHRTREQVICTSSTSLQIILLYSSFNGTATYPHCSACFVPRSIASFFTPSLFKRRPFSSTSCCVHSVLSEVPTLALLPVVSFIKSLHNLTSMKNVHVHPIPQPNTSLPTLLHLPSVH